MSTQSSNLLLSKYVLIGGYRKTRLSPLPLLEQYREPVKDLLNQHSSSEVTVDHDGHPRTLTNFEMGGYAQAVYFGHNSQLHDFLRSFTAKYLARKTTCTKLDLDGIKLAFVQVIELSYMRGQQRKKLYKVIYGQKLPSTMKEDSGRIRQSSVVSQENVVELYIRPRRGRKYEIVKVVSSLARSKAPDVLEFRLSPAQARAKAVRAVIDAVAGTDANAVPAKNATVLKCVATANPHRGKLRPIYRIHIEAGTAEVPYLVEAIVDAKNGKVVFARPLALHARQSDSADCSGGTPKLLATIPADALVNVAKRDGSIQDQFLKDLQIDASLLRKQNGLHVLVNQWLRVLFPIVDPTEKMTWFETPTRPQDGSANAGTFKWDANDPQSSGVIAYISYLMLIQLFLDEALRIPDGMQIKVYVDHRWNRNNATFYPQYLMIQIGWGDGMFMLPHIVYDLVVCDHEYVHAIVFFLRRSDGYIPGPLGAALNEGIADFVATLMRLLKWLTFGDKKDGSLTYAKLMADAGAIGAYCLGGNGFRNINNNLVYPKDLNGDNAHDNSRIVSAATYHTFLAWIKQEVEQLVHSHGLDEDTALRMVLPNVVRNFARLVVAAVPMLPANRVTFSDWRKALEDADTLAFGGAHHNLIATGFDPHGITTNAVVVSRLRAKKVAA